MAHDVRRQHELTKALETASASRNGADKRWRAAIAEALAAGVPRDVILKTAGGWDVIEVQDILRELDDRERTSQLETGGSRRSLEQTSASAG